MSAEKECLKSRECLSTGTALAVQPASTTGTLRCRESFPDSLAQPQRWPSISLDKQIQVHFVKHLECGRGPNGVNNYLVKGNFTNQNKNNVFQLTTKCILFSFTSSVNGFLISSRLFCSHQSKLPGTLLLSLHPHVRGVCTPNAG